MTLATDRAKTAPPPDPNHYRHMVAREYADAADNRTPTLPVPDMDAIVAHPLASLKSALKPPPVPRECRSKRRHRGARALPPMSPLQAEKADLMDQLRTATHFRRECLLVALKRVDHEIERDAKRSEAK
jgi:hypothetical protein